MGMMSCHSFLIICAAVPGMHLRETTNNLMKKPGYTGRKAIDTPSYPSKKPVPLEEKVTAFHYLHDKHVERDTILAESNRGKSQAHPESSEEYEAYEEHEASGNDRITVSLYFVIACIPGSLSYGFLAMVQIAMDKLNYLASRQEV